MRRKNGLKSWLFIAAAVVLGAKFSDEIEKFLIQLPIVGKYFKKDTSN